MRKIIVVSVGVLLTSCGAIYGGQVTDYQRTRPLVGQPTRAIRPAALIGDILFFPFISLPVDFLTGAIYQPQSPTNAATQNAAQPASSPDAGTDAPQSPK